MGAILSYSLICGLMMCAMYVAYSLLLAREKQYAFNRAVLLLIYFISFVAIPVIYYICVRLHFASSAHLSENLEIVNEAVKTSYNPLWSTWLIWGYIAGTSVVFIRTIIIWIRLIGVIRSGKRYKREGYTLVVTDNEKYAPFSWMRFVVISRKDYDDNNQAIITHELKHIASRHWIDLLVSQVVCIINWFNPAAWLMRDQLMLVHEYQADMAVIDSGHDAQEYQLLLIKKAVGTRFPSLANSLNHSKLKKRITMMYKAKSGAGSKIKALALVPMLALALGAASVPAVRAAVTTISSSKISVSKDSENPAAGKTPVHVYKVTNINVDGNVTTVKIKGEGLGDHLTVSGGRFTSDGKTWQANSLRCEMTDGKATIVATFPCKANLSDASMSLTVNGEEVPFLFDKIKK